MEGTTEKTYAPREMYSALTHTQMPASMVTYQFTYKLLQDVRKLFRGKLTEGGVIRAVLTVLKKNAAKYEEFLAFIKNSFPESHNSIGKKSLPIGYLADIGTKEWKRLAEAADTDEIDRLRKVFSGTSYKLKNAMKGKEGCFFHNGHLRQALFAFVDFHTLLKELIQHDEFVEAISNKDAEELRQSYAEQLNELEQQFLDGLERYCCSEVDQPEKMNLKEAQAGMVVKVVTVDDMIRELVDVLPWCLVNQLELEDLTSQLDMEIILAGSEMQSLAFQWEVDVDDETKIDNGGVLFFKTLKGEYILLSICSEQGWSSELQVACFKTQAEFISAFTELLNNWNPSFRELERNRFSVSTTVDVEHALKMVLQ